MQLLVLDRAVKGVVIVQSERQSRTKKSGSCYEKNSCMYLYPTWIEKQSAFVMAVLALRETLAKLEEVETKGKMDKTFRWTQRIVPII